MLNILIHSVDCSAFRRPACARAGRGASRMQAPLRWMVSAISIVLLAACAAPPERSAPPAPQKQALEQLHESVVAESRVLSERQTALLQAMQSAPSVRLEMPAAKPAFDPLEAKRITVTVARASIGQILAAFADAGQLNLVVDPQVLKGDQLADLYLREVSLREGMLELFRLFDVTGDIHARTLRVRLHEERFFELGFMNTRSTLTMGSGGNVFGAAGGSGSAQQGNLTLSANGGLAQDPYQEIESALKNVLGLDAAGNRSASGGGAATANAATAGASANALAQPGAAAVAGFAPPPPPPAAVSMADGVYSLDRMTGTLYVKARPSKMRAVERMLAIIEAALRRQVHIEAQLIDVALSDSYEFGVDWFQLRSRLAATFGTSPLVIGGVAGALPGAGGVAPRAVTIPSTLIGSATGGPSLGIGYQGERYGVVINALRSFGHLKVLSNPNVQVRNGTPALLSVGTTTRYVSQTSTLQTAPGGGATTTQANVQTDSVFSGVMVGVIPHIRANGEIELIVNPMQSDVDPASLQLIEVGGGNRISLPQLSYKGMTTTLNVKDGDMVVLGGLIDQRSGASDRGAPGVSDVPVFGKLFGNENRAGRSRELVLVLRVKVL